MQENLRRLVEGRSRLLAALSHDLRTPLTLLRLRLEGLDGGEERERLLATVGGMEEMVGTTLDFARQTTLSAPRRPTDLAALLASIVDDMADAGRAVTLIPAPPVVCAVQATALRRAVTNLIDNAIKFGGSAEVSLGQAAGQIRIAVRDHGPGIPEAALGRVFEPFYRVEESRSAETGGSGLGLSIAQSIVQAHGGEVRLANQPGGGLLAEITLPGPG
jgi:signal transduction histidine kinase